MSEIKSMGNRNHQGTLPSGTFIVYFDDQAYMWKLARNIVVTEILVGVFFLIAWMNHKIFPRFIAVSLLAFPVVILLLSFLSHRAHDRDYIGSGGKKKKYLECTAEGIRFFEGSMIAWKSISSVKVVTAAASGRGGKTSWILLKFSDDRAMSSFSSEELRKLTSDNAWIKGFTKYKDPILSENNFIAVVVAGEDSVSANLTASVMQIESTAERFHAHARIEKN